MWYTNHYVNNFLSRAFGSIDRMALRRLFAALSLAGILLVPAGVLAQDLDPSDPETFRKYNPPVSSNVETDIGMIAKNIIGVVMGFLGLFAVVIIIIAGFKWMTAGGDEKKVEEAKNQLIQGAIGLVIIIASWSIAFFVIEQIAKVVGGQ